MIYADNAATTPIDPMVIEVCSRAMKMFYGNPSSLHPVGRKAKEVLNLCRDSISEDLNAGGYQIIFNSGATEGNNTAIAGAMELQAANGKNHIVISAMEHQSVYNTCFELAERHGYTVSVVYPEPNGVVLPESVENAITDRTGLVSIMMVNNELGTVQPVSDIAMVAHKRGALFHTDAVQAVAHMPIDMDKLGADILTFTGHKIYGPKGVGCMIYRNRRFPNLLYGGHQEFGVRPGTESVAQVTGLMVALHLLRVKGASGYQMQSPATQAFLNKLEEWSGEYKLNPSGCDTISMRIPNIRVEDAVILLGEEGLCVSSGSACSAGSHEVSRTLKAIGLTSAEAEETIRISFGRNNSAEDGTAAAQTLISTLFSESW